MAGSLIEFGKENGKHQGYLAKPSGSGPAVIVLQEWWGLVGHIKSVTDRFAEAGFVALAPDLYDGDSATEPDEAGSLMMALNISESERKMQEAARYLLALDATTSKKVGVVGFCMGGQLSLYAASTSPDLIGACVNFYGIHPNVQPPLTNLQAPVLGFFAEHDEYASPEIVEALSRQLTVLEKTHDFHTFPGTRHAFFNDDRREVYNREAAEESWTKMIQFFREQLT